MEVVNEEQKKFDEKLSEIVEKIRLTSRFMVVATNQMGKTDVSMHLFRAIMKRSDHAENKVKTIDFDPAVNLRYKFDKVPFIDRTKVRHVPLAQDLIVDIPFINASLKRDAVMEVLSSDFIHKRKLKMEHNGNNPFYNFYIIDEMQNIWGTYALRKKDGESALTIFSESSNYGMVIIGLSQRFADVATGVVERCAYYLVGRLSGDNELKKLQRMVDNEKIISQVRGLKRGEFVFIDKDNPEYSVEIDFNEFKQVGTPYELTETKPVGVDGIVREIF